VSTDFTNWINVSLETSPSINNYKEVESLVDGKIAEAVQRDIRTTVDTGSRAAGAKAEGVRVKAEEGGFVIFAKSHDDVLRATSKQVGGGKSAVEAGSMDDLFSQSSGVPEAKTGPGGTTKLVYKSISIGNLFKEQKEKARTFAIEQAVTQSVRMNLGNAYNEAMDEVDQKNPVMK
jgi:hypothetical protein